MNKIVYFMIIALLILPACQTMKRPSTDPAKMSSDALCYRAETKKSEEILSEIDRRNLDCRSILSSDPILNQQRY